MSMGFGALMTVDRMGGGTETDTTGEATTVNSSLLCDVEPSGDSTMWWAKSELVEVSALPSVGSAATMSSEVIERAWFSTDMARDDVATRIKGCGA
jgi:hypothetical protein